MTPQAGPAHVDSNGLNLVAVDGSPLVAVTGALEGHFAVRVGEPRQVSRVYYDTFDGRLAAAGLGLWAELASALDVASLTLTLADGRRLTGASSGPAPSRLFAAELPPGPLREALSRVTEVRVILETVRLRLTTQDLVVLDELDKIVVRLAIEEPEGLGGRVRIEGLRGYESESGRAVKLLTTSASLQVASETLLHEAVRAVGGVPDGVRTEVGVALEPDEPADQAAARVLTRLQGVLDANLPGVLDDLDIEFLHDYRVSLRRIRAVVRELEGVFPGARLDHYRAELKWLQNITGQTRDLDVHLGDLAPGGTLWELVPEQLREQLDPLREVLAEHRQEARRQLVAELRSERAELLRWQWTRLLDMLPLLPLGDRPDARRPLSELASKRVRKVHRRMLRMGRAITPHSPPEDYHELRKQGKELRYLLELLGRPLHGSDTVDPLIKVLKRLQDILGRHQDREVQIQTLRSVADAVQARAGAGQALIAVGALIGRLEEDAAMARAEFDERFELFASKSQRRLVRDTFGK